MVGSSDEDSDWFQVEFGTRSKMLQSRAETCQILAFWACVFIYIFISTSFLGSGRRELPCMRNKVFVFLCGGSSGCRERVTVFFVTCGDTIG